MGKVSNLRSSRQLKEGQKFLLSLQIKLPLAQRNLHTTEAPVGWFVLNSTPATFHLNYLPVSIIGHLNYFSSFPAGPSVFTLVCPQSILNTVTTAILSSISQAVLLLCTKLEQFLISFKVKKGSPCKGLQNLTKPHKIFLLGLIFYWYPLDSLCSRNTGILAFPRILKHSPTSGPLCLLFPLSERHLPPLPTWLTPLP